MESNQRNHNPPVEQAITATNNATYEDAEDIQNKF